MRVLIYDTETNGLPKSYSAPPTDCENWPHIIQIAWQVWDVESCLCLQQASLLIKPDPYMIWCHEAAEIHKISLERLQREGLPFTKVLSWFVSDAKETDLILAHNLSFDKRVLWAECFRQVKRGFHQFDPESWWPKHELCSMLSTVNVCKIPSTSKYATIHDPYKWPKLVELFTHLFPDTALPDNLHDAGTDVAVLVKCFHELTRRRVLALPAVERTPDRLVDLLLEVLRSVS